MAKENPQTSSSSYSLEELEVGFIQLFRTNPTYFRFWLSF